MKDFVFLMGFLSLFVFEISRAITWEDERESFISRFQDLYKEDIDIHEKIVEKDKKIDKLIEQADLQNKAIEWLKIENEALRSRTIQNENKIEEITEQVDLQNKTIEWLKIENEALRSRTNQNENKIDNNVEEITNLSGMYLYSYIANVHRQNG